MQQPFDAFALAKSFDAMRSGATAPLAPVETPQVQPIQYGGSLPGAPSPVARNQAPVQGAAPVRSTIPANSDWGSRTAALQAQFPNLRHTSGYRDPAHNARTPGASPTSYHMQRDAQGNSRANDYAGSARDMQAGAAWARANGAREVLIHNAGTGQHLHVAWS